MSTANAGSSDTSEHVFEMKKEAQESGAGRERTSQRAEGGNSQRDSKVLLRKKRKRNKRHLVS